MADELPDLDLAVPAVTTIEPARTFWDKVVIAHGLRAGTSAAALENW